MNLRGEYEEREVPTDQGMALVVSKKAQFVGPGKTPGTWVVKVRLTREEVAARKLGQTVDASRGQPAPATVPVPLPEGATRAGIDSWEEFPVGQKVGYELTKIVDDKGRIKRVTVAAGMFALKPGRTGRPPKAMFVECNYGGQKGLYFMNPKKLISVPVNKGLRTKHTEMAYKVVFDALYSDPLAIDGTLEWDDDLEGILADSTIDQFVLIAASGLGFRLTPELIRAAEYVAALSIMIGLAANGIYHIVPITEVHWIP